MKLLSLLMWVGQFGLSAIFPTLFFLILAAWLQSRFGLGMWIMVVFGIIGVLTSIQTVRSCYASLRKAAEEVSETKEPPVCFNDHM